MGKTTQIVINLEPNLEEFVRDEVKRGSFSSGSEYERTSCVNVMKTTG
jgi:Arc/MetJ-type ribon-helix-helix transcriptional regulator